VLFKTNGYPVIASPLASYLFNMLMLKLGVAAKTTDDPPEIEVDV
jgi:hypothetical protein